MRFNLNFVAGRRGEAILGRRRHRLAGKTLNIKKRLYRVVGCGEQENQEMFWLGMGASKEGELEGGAEGSCCRKGGLLGVEESRKAETLKRGGNLLFARQTPGKS